MIEGADPVTDSAPAETPSSDSPTDTALLQAHVDGDAQAFADLVARHQDRLWAVALQMMRNPDDAADALQDAYISAFRRAATYRGEARVMALLNPDQRAALVWSTCTATRSRRRRPSWVVPSAR